MRVRIRKAAAVRLFALPVAVLLALLLATLGPGQAGAAVILSPVAVLSNSLGEWGPCCDIGNAIDQSGLDPGFISGVTDFDAYMASNPLHSFSWESDEEFFSSLEGELAGTIVLDLGASFLLDRLALWNEDGQGIDQMIVWTSDDPNFHVGVTDHGTFSPTDNPYTKPGTNYPADVFALSTVRDRYVQIGLSCLPNPTPGWTDACGIGEIAFSAVPEPTTAFLLGLGLAGLAAFRRQIPFA